jgi:GTPase SAR1 family protein
LDPANEYIPYEASVDIRDLVKIDKIMDEKHLGPNGSILYCIEYLEKNINWLKEKIESNSSDSKTSYILFDCPGQLELYTHHQSIRNIFREFMKWDYRLTSVNLIDFHHCIDPFKYLSAVLISLITMLQLELPHVNVLSKMDLVKSFENLPFDLDFYAEVQDLTYLLPYLEGKSQNYDTKDSLEIANLSRQRIFAEKHQALSRALVDLIQDYSLVSYFPLLIEDHNCMMELVKLIDKANGYMLFDQETEDSLDSISTLDDIIGSNIKLSSRDKGL